MPKPITSHERKALRIFLDEREALFAILEDNRLLPLPADIAHRGRAAIAGGLRLLNPRRVARTNEPPNQLAAPLPDSDPLMPVDLFLALCEVSTTLESEFRQRPQAVTKIYPRALQRA